MTFRAMPRSIHKVGAAVVLRRFFWIGDERAFAEKEQLPYAEQSSLVEWKRQLVPVRPALHLRQRFQISEEIANIVDSHVPIGGVGKRRIEVGAVFRGPLPQCSNEIRLGPGADSVLGIGRNVGRVERAKGRLQGQTAAEPLAI